MAGANGAAVAGLEEAAPSSSAGVRSSSSGWVPRSPGASKRPRSGRDRTRIHRKPSWRARRWKLSEIQPCGLEPCGVEQVFCSGSGGPASESGPVGATRCRCPPGTLWHCRVPSRIHLPPSCHAGRTRRVQQQPHLIRPGIQRCVSAPSATIERPEDRRRPRSGCSWSLSTHPHLGPKDAARRDPRVDFQHHRLELLSRTSFSTSPTAQTARHARFAMIDSRSVSRTAYLGTVSNAPTFASQPARVLPGTRPALSSLR